MTPASYPASARPRKLPLRNACWPLPAACCKQGATFSLALRATFSAAFCAVTVAWAQPGPADVQRALDLAQQNARASSPLNARLLVHAGALDSRLKLAPCAQVEPFLAAGAPPWGHTRIGLRCEQGAVKWKVYLPVNVQVWAPAWAAAQALPAGGVLSAEQLNRVDVDWAGGMGKSYFSERTDLLGRSLGRALPAGQALRVDDLLPRRWFAAGDSVTLLATGPGFSIGGHGQALSAGLEGQPVRVRTPSGQVLTGRATGQAQVEVNL